MKLFKIIALLAALGTAGLTLTSCLEKEDNSAVEQAGEQVEDAADKAADTVEDAGDKVEDAADKAADKVEDATDKAND